ncbi:MAG: 50S ribosome-binding GTPase, partial [Armatimonadetes bacterium]|nr:50S ribosome-binding GTPase [Armatimonadota bacterium]
MSVRALDFLKHMVTGRQGCGCETCALAAPVTRRTVMLVGSPNVGKSVIFNDLTGRYAVVSNYPGTTVEVTRGQARVGDVLLEIADSPGSYSLAAVSEDEQVTQRLIMEERAYVVVHVVDAKSLRRMLPLTFQFIEAGAPLVLDVNIIDEAERVGLSVEPGLLGEELGLPVVATAAARGVGMDGLCALLGGKPPERSDFRVGYPEPVESAASRIVDLLDGEYGIARRAVALLLLQREARVWERVIRCDADSVVEIERIVAEAEAKCGNPVGYVIAVARQKEADRIARRALRRSPKPIRRDFREVLGALAMHPLAGIPLLVAVVYVGLYLFVGRLGAGVAVDFLDKQVFGRYINPPVTAFFTRVLPWPAVADLFVGEYGMITLGLRYALALVLPLVGAFFLMFSLLEDSGYL